MQTIRIKKDITQEVYKFLDTIYPYEQKTIMAISGGPDSMLAATILHHYWINKNRNIDNIHHIYCDHKVREHNDADTIQSYIRPIQLHIFSRLKGSKNTENELRKRRYSKINTYAKKHKINILITGHHLSDRIESSFLHMLRGCSLDGFVSMHREEDTTIFNGKIIRPLLNLSKRHILSLCKEHGIPYIQDKTNKNVSISKRNMLRHKIMKPLLELANKDTISNNTFEQSMQNIYKALETLVFSTEPLLKPIPMCKIWKTKRAYQWVIERQNITGDMVKNLLTYLRISTNTTQKNIGEITKFLQNNASGHKYMNNTYFFISHGHIYIIQGPKKFRELSIKKLPKNPRDMFSVQNKIFPMTESRRLPTAQDKIKGKSRSKRCINNKIPLFRRKYIPLVTDKNNHIKPYIFDFIQK